METSEMLGTKPFSWQVIGEYSDEIKGHKNIETDVETHKGISTYMN